MEFEAKWLLRLPRYSTGFNAEGLTRLVFEARINETGERNNGQTQNFFSKVCQASYLLIVSHAGVIVKTNTGLKKRCATSSGFNGI